MVQLLDMKYLTIVVIGILLCTTIFFGHSYLKSLNVPNRDGSPEERVDNGENSNIQVTETKINNTGSCRSIGSTSDIYPPGKYQFIKEYVKDTGWKCVGGEYGGDMFTCSGKEIPTSRVRAQIGDVIDVCKVINTGSISEPKWELDIGRNASNPTLSIPLSYVKKVSDTTPASY